MPYKNPNSPEAKESQRLRKQRYLAKHRDRHLQGMRDAAAKHADQRKQYAQEHREMIRENVRRWRKANAQKHRAHKAVMYAVKTGKIIRPETCGACGAIRKIQAHHYLGYEKEHYLHVIWLCQPCHKLAERES